MRNGHKKASVSRLDMLAESSFVGMDSGCVSGPHEQ